MSGLYRIGQEDSRLTYRGDKLFAMVFDAVDAETVVREWNAAEPAESEPEMFRDADGDVWTRMANGFYSMRGDPESVWSLEQIKDEYGTWTENAS